MTQVADRARFDCHGCGEPWFAPPDTGCPRCGPGSPCDVDERIWELSEVVHPALPYRLFITAHMRDVDRLFSIGRLYPGAAIVDIANDPQQKIVWRPSPRPDEDTLRTANVYWFPVWGLKDLREGSLDEGPFFAGLQILHSLSIRRDQSVIVHCAAGLRRAPALVYGYLRTLGLARGTSWSLIADARPLANFVPDYIRGVEDFLTRRGSAFRSP